MAARSSVLERCSTSFSRASSPSAWRASRASLRSLASPSWASSSCARSLSAWGRSVQSRGQLKPQAGVGVRGYGLGRAGTASRDGHGQHMASGAGLAVLVSPSPGSPSAWKRSRQPSLATLWSSPRLPETAGWLSRASPRAQAGGPQGTGHSLAGLAGDMALPTSLYCPPVQVQLPLPGGPRHLCLLLSFNNGVAPRAAVFPGVGSSTHGPGC